MSSRSQHPDSGPGSPQDALLHQLPLPQPEADNENLAAELAQLGSTLYEAEDNQAVTAYEHSVALTRPLLAAQPERFQLAMADRISELGRAYLMAGQVELAIPCWMEGLELYAALALSSHISFAAERAELLSSLALESLPQGQLEETIRLTTEAIALLEPMLTAEMEQVGDLMVRALWTRSVALDASGNKPAALADAVRCRQLAADPRIPEMEPGIRDAIEGQFCGLQTEAAAPSNPPA